MKTKTLNEQEVIHEAMTVQLEHLEPAQVTKFLAARPVAGSDYLKRREQLFAGETVASLAAKIRAFGNTSKNGGLEPIQRPPGLHTGMAERLELDEVR